MSKVLTTNQDTYLSSFFYKTRLIILKYYNLIVAQKKKDMTYQQRTKIPHILKNRKRYKHTNASTMLTNFTTHKGI